MKTGCALLMFVLMAASAPASSTTTLDADEVADLVSRPSTALYKAYAEFKMAHYAEARQIWQALADKDVAESWFNLGVLAEDGLGEPRDPEKALALYERGARGGSVKAQYRLALIHLEGRLVKPDRSTAERWLQAAASAGHDDSIRQLAMLGDAGEADDYLGARLLESEGRVEDAAAIYQRLSDQGDLPARTRLAWMHEAGRGVPRDLGLAADLFESAAVRGEAEAQFALAVMLRTGAGRPQDVRAADVWLRKAAEAGHQEAIAMRALDGVDYNSSQIDAATTGSDSNPGRAK